MKVAILFSGLLRTDYETWIGLWKKVAYDADFYYAAWESDPKRTDQLKIKDTEHKGKQQIIHAEAVRSLNLEEKYDVIVRARYDVEITFDRYQYEQILNYVKDGSIVCLSFAHSLTTKLPLGGDLAIFYEPWMMPVRNILNNAEKLFNDELGWSECIDAKKQVTLLCSRLHREQGFVPRRYR